MTRLGDTTADNPAITAKTADFQLSQEETGFSLIIQDVSKDNEHVVEFNLEKVCFTNLWWKKNPHVIVGFCELLFKDSYTIRRWARWLYTHNIEACIWSICSIESVKFCSFHALCDSIGHGV